MLTDIFWRLVKSCCENFGWLFPKHRTTWCIGWTAETTDVFICLLTTIAMRMKLKIISKLVAYINVPKHLVDVSRERNVKEPSFNET